MGIALHADQLADPSAGLRAEFDALADDHEALLAFVYASPVGLAQTDLQGKVELVNPVTAMLLLPLTRRGGLDNLFSVLEPVAPDLAQRVAAYPHMHGIVCDGLRLTLSAPMQPLQVVSLRMVKLDPRRLMVALVDITEQVRAERARQRAEDRLRLAMEAAQAADWQIDVPPQGEPLRLHVRCPEGLELGLPPMPPEGWTLDELYDCVDEQDLHKVQTTVAVARQQRTMWRCEFKLRGVPGRPQRWLTMHGQPRRQDDESPARWTGLLLDTTVHREADMLRRQALALDAENRALRQAGHLKSQFVAAMTHELRTPLTSVIGFTELLRGGVATAGSLQFDECVEHIAANSRHLLQLVNDVLDLAKIEAEKMEFEPAPLDLRLLAQQVRDALGPQWRSKSLRLRIEIADGLGDLLLDPMRLRQVLYNLLSNAVKFTPDGGDVDVRAWPADGATFVLEVADTGIGIRESDLPRLFVEFQQLEAGHGRRHVGTGLGLALTRRLVQAQGGEITVRSSFGQGSVFRVRMPRVHAAGAMAQGVAG